MDTIGFAILTFKLRVLYYNISVQNIFKISLIKNIIVHMKNTTLFFSEQILLIPLHIG